MGKVLTMLHGTIYTGRTTGQPTSDIIAGMGNPLVSQTFKKSVRIKHIIQSLQLEATMEII